jgi:hypothetical protein
MSRTDTATPRSGVNPRDRLRLRLGAGMISVAAPLGFPAVENELRPRNVKLLVPGGGRGRH